MSEWTAEWSGAFPNICSGEWSLFRDGVEVSTSIPFQGEPAGTFGEYEDWLDVFESYESGKEADDWVAEHRGWLSSFADEGEFVKIYDAFNAADWRHGECGGCI